MVRSQPLPGQMTMKAPKRKNWFLRLIMILLGAGLLGIVAGYLALTSWMQNYLRSDACREMLARQIGDATRARCEIEPVSWSGANAYSPKLSLQSEGAAGWKRLEADGLQAALDWSGVRRGVWLVPTINLDSLTVTSADATGSAAPRILPATSSSDAKAAAVEPGWSSWLKLWLPQRTEIGEIDVRRFDLEPAAPGSGVALAAIHLKAQPSGDEGAWRITGADGSVRIPGLGELFRLDRASARFDSRALVLNEAAARWRGDSEVTARGEVPFAGGRGWIFSGRLSGLDLQHVVADAWKPKVGGVVEGDYEVANRPGPAISTKGKLRIKSGVVQALPLLDRVADYTHTARFRRIVLDEAAGDVALEGARTRVTNLVLQSNGLIRVEGELLIDGRLLSGDLLVGVSPETLRWMPGAQNHVFTDANTGKVSGFVWTRVVVSGTLDSPKENLSNRLLSAMGQAVLLDAPMEVLGTGLDVIGKGGAAVPGGQEVIETGKGVIQGAGEAAERGLDALKGLVPLLPK
jgi:hypothetical protein